MIINPWNVFPPTKQQEKWKEIPDSVFWIKITVIVTIIMLFGFLIFGIINN